MEVIKIFPTLAHSIVLVIPPKRLNKINKILKESHYIGHPLYMENKLVYSFSNHIAETYLRLSNQANLSLEKVIPAIQAGLISPKL